MNATRKSKKSAAVDRTCTVELWNGDQLATTVQALEPAAAWIDQYNAVGTGLVAKLPNGVRQQKGIGE